MEDYIKDDDTDTSVAFRNLYHENDHCDLHNLDFNVEIDWDGITVPLLLRIIHTDFNAKIRYQSEKLENHSAQILEFQGCEDSFRRWIEEQTAARRDAGG